MKYICHTNGKIVGSLEWLVNNVSKSGLTIYEYFDKYYKVENKQNCNFCKNRLAIPTTYTITEEENKVIYFYDKGFACNDIVCKNEISLKFLGTKYNIETYQRIGAKSEYLAIKRGVTIAESKKLKSSIHRKKFQCNLNGFIEKYGEKEGTIRYNSRCENVGKGSANKISYYMDKFGDNWEEEWLKHRAKISVNLDGYVLRYGEEEGTRKYKERGDRIGYTGTKEFFVEKYGDEAEERWKNYIAKNSVSKTSLIIKEILDELKISYHQEYSIVTQNKRRYKVDYYLYEYNIAVEFYGDYWHCNPKKYNENYFHSYKKMTAKEIRKIDKKRTKYISDKLNCSIIIVWESAIVDTTILKNMINKVLDKKVIKQIK